MSRRIKVFRAYNRFGVTIIRMVEKAGLNKSVAAIPYIRDETIREMLQLCIETPYHGLRTALQTAYPQSDAAAGATERPRKNYVGMRSAALCV